MPNGLPGCGVDFGVACSVGVRVRRGRAAQHAADPDRGERQRLLGPERRKARQVRWAKKYNQGRYSGRLRRIIAELVGLKARQARRRADFTHKLTTDLAKRHGWPASRTCGCTT